MGWLSSHSPIAQPLPPLLSDGTFKEALHDYALSKKHMNLHVLINLNLLPGKTSKQSKSCTHFAELKCAHSIWSSKYTVPHSVIALQMIFYVLLFNSFCFKWVHAPEVWWPHLGFIFFFKFQNVKTAD